MTYTMVDGIVLIVLVLSTLLAWSRGIIREGMSIIGWIIALIVAAKFAHLMVPIVQDLPFVKDYLADSCELLTAVGFVALFVAGMIVMALITPLMTGMIQNSALSAFDGGLGALFGFARGIAIVLLVIIIYDNFVQASTPLPMIEQSKSYAIFSSPKETITDQLPDQDAAPSWIAAQFDSLTSHCAVPANNAAAIDG